MKQLKVFLLMKWMFDFQFAIFFWLLYTTYASQLEFLEKKESYLITF